MLNKYTRYIMIAAVAVSGHAMAQSDLSTTDPKGLLRSSQLTTLPLTTATRPVYSSNPATMTYSDSISLSAIRLTGFYSHQGEAVMEQLGTGHRGVSIIAESYMHMSPKTTVWGNAGFTTGQTDDIKWTNCIDYLRVAPYVLGDEVGGDLSSRKYSFAGGYSGLFGKWTVGISADYRAEIAYRNRDPRVKTVVSDLNINLGGSYRLFPRYVIGLRGGLNIYNQNCDLDFYNPINDINTYTLTGLGTYYKRFMGNSNENSGYESLGFNAALQFVSVDREGFMGNVEFDHYKMEQQLRNFNNLTLGFSDVNTLSAKLLYKLRIGNKMTLQPSVEGFLRNHKGTENLFGTSAGASYDKIGSRSVYRHNTSMVKVSLPLQIQQGMTYITVEPFAAYDSDCEKYIDPKRKLQASHLTPGINSSLSANSESWLWKADLGGSYSKASSENPILTGLETDTPLGQLVLHNFDMLKADRYSLNAGVSASRIINGICFELSADYRYVKYVKKTNCHYATITLCAKF